MMTTLQMWKRLVSDLPVSSPAQALARRGLPTSAQFATAQNEYRLHKGVWPWFGRTDYAADGINFTRSVNPELVTILERICDVRADLH